VQLGDARARLRGAAGYLLGLAVIDTHKLNRNDFINMLPSGCTRNCQQGRHCDCVPDVPTDDEPRDWTAAWGIGAVLITLGWAAFLVWQLTWMVLQ